MVPTDTHEAVGETCPEGGEEGAGGVPRAYPVRAPDDVGVASSPANGPPAEDVHKAVPVEEGTPGPIAVPVAGTLGEGAGVVAVAPMSDAAAAVHTELATVQADQDPRKDRHGNPACASLFLDFLPAETCAADLEPVVAWLPGFVAIRLGNKKLRQGEHRTCVVEFADVDSAVAARMQIQGQIVPLHFSFSSAQAPLVRLVVNFVREPIPGSPQLGGGGQEFGRAAEGNTVSDAPADAQESVAQVNPYVDEHGNFASKTLFISNLNPALDGEYLRGLFPGAISVRVSRKELAPGDHRTAFVQLPSVGTAVEERTRLIGHTDEQQNAPLDISFRRSSHPRGGVVLHHTAAGGSPVMSPMLSMGSPLAGPSLFAPLSPPPIGQGAAGGGYSQTQGYAGGGTYLDGGGGAYGGVASPYYMCMPGAYGSPGASVNGYSACSAYPAYGASYAGTYGGMAPGMMQYYPYSSDPAINMYGMQGLDMYWGFWRDTCGNPATSILFIDNLPSFVTPSSLSRIFQRSPGFQNVHLSRKALLPHERRTCLAFFTDVYSASCARQMWQGHREANWDHAMVINFKKARDTGSARTSARHAVLSIEDDAATSAPAAAAAADASLPTSQRWGDTPPAWELAPESAATTTVTATATTATATATAKAAGPPAEPAQQSAPRARRRAAQAAALRTARGRQAAQAAQAAAQVQHQQQHA